jgi:hypothetical protein
MPFDVNEISAEHVTVKAGEDLRTYQHYAMKVTNNGVIRSTGLVTSGQAFVLMNRPNSGEAATLYGPPNVAKAISGAAVVTGMYMTDVASAYFIQGSFGNAYGYAQETVNSGSIFALRLL